MKDHDALIGQSNDRIILLAAFLREAGVDARAHKPEHDVHYALSIKLDRTTLDVRSIVMKRGHGYRATYEFGGFTIRWDWLGARGMGSTRYPLRKDGTVDVQRLKGDIEAYRRRRSQREDAEAAIAANQRELADEGKALKEIAAGLLGVFAKVENDGRSEGRLRFEVSGYVSPARLRAILAAVAAADAPQEKT